jgi:hypothetical protein
MKSVIGIVILVICAIGIYSILRWVFTQVSALFSKHLVKQPGQQQKPKKQKFIRIGHERKLVCYDDLPEANKYKGRTWIGGLPVYADIVAPDKHDYSTVIYMDHWFKQYVHDVMLGLPVTKEHWKNFSYWLFFPVMFVVAGVSFIKVLIVTSIIFAWLFLWYLPSGMPITRGRAEKFKNFTPETWAKIYDDVAKDLAEEEKLVSAIRRSGMHRPW